MGPGGYVWWYVDALSDDGRYALTMIAFIGSVFSPYYAWSGRRDPSNHTALNVALYGPTAARWAMTERKRSALEQTPDSLTIGPSRIGWDGRSLVVDVREFCFPLPRRLRGQVRITPEVGTNAIVHLDDDEHHGWWPIAPRCRIETCFTEPDLRWSGVGYLDTNWGAVPLEESFADWTWSRAPTGRGATILYDVARRNGDPLAVAIRIDESGAVASVDAPAIQRLPTTLWGIRRETRSQAPSRVVRTLEDTPFYARSVVEQQLDGEQVEAVHESLSLRRFSTQWVKVLLPFRMPRTGATGTVDSMSSQ